MKQRYDPCRAVTSGPWPDGWIICGRPVARASRRGRTLCELHQRRGAIWPTGGEAPGPAARAEALPAPE